MVTAKNSSFPRIRESNLLILPDSRFRESEGCELLEFPL